MSAREVLRRVHTFGGLTDEECDVVLSVLKARKGAPGDVLFRQGEPGDSLVLVLDGQLSVRVQGDAGESEVARLGPGEVVGELSFLDAEPRSATVSTPAGATVLHFTRAGLHAVARAAPRAAASILRNVLSDLSRRLRDAGEKLAEADVRGDAPASIRPRGKPVTADALRRMPALARHGEEDLQLLAHIATLCTFPAGAVIAEQDAPGDACWLVLSGQVQVTRRGSWEPLATLGAGALVGQLALLDRAPRSATMTAIGETLLLELRADAFQNLVRASSPIALRFQEQVALAGARQLRLATRKLASAAGAAPQSLRELDDWDDAVAPGPDLELAIDLKR